MAEVSRELLQAMMQRMLDGLAEVKLELRDVKMRLTGIEHELAVMRRHDAVDAEARALAQLRIDRLEERIERIERRLELSDA